MYDFVSGVVRLAAAIAFLGSRVPKKVKRRGEIWTSEDQRRSMSRTVAAESEQLLGGCRSAASAHEEQYYALRMARNPQARAEGMRYIIIIILISSPAFGPSIAITLLY